MKNIPYILVIFLLFSCNQMNNDKKEIVEIVDDCQLKEFVLDFPNNTQVKSVYFECESDLKFKLQIERDHEIIFEADTLLEYEFNEYSFPTYIADGDFEYLLIERSDSCILTKLDVFRISANKVDSVFTIPNFEGDGMDIDNDGITEFWATMEFVEGNGSGTIGYNPILAYEIEKDIIRFDSSTTIDLNEKVYGKYHGLEIIDTLFYNGNDAEAKWPYPY